MCSVEKVFGGCIRAVMNVILVVCLQSIEGNFSKSQPGGRMFRDIRIDVTQPTFITIMYNCASQSSLAITPAPPRILLEQFFETEY